MFDNSPLTWFQVGLGAVSIAVLAYAIAVCWCESHQIRDLKATENRLMIVCNQLLEESTKNIRLLAEKQEILEENEELHDIVQMHLANGLSPSSVGEYTSDLFADTPLPFNVLDFQRPDDN